jgi:hypothetical protein
MLPGCNVGEIETYPAPVGGRTRRHLDEQEAGQLPRMDKTLAGRCYVWGFWGGSLDEKRDGSAEAHGTEERDSRNSVSGPTMIP